MLTRDAFLRLWVKTVKSAVVLYKTRMADLHY